MEPLTVEPGFIPRLQMNFGSPCPMERYRKKGLDPLRNDVMDFDDSPWRVSLFLGSGWVEGQWEAWEGGRARKCRDGYVNKSVFKNKINK